MNRRGMGGDEVAATTSEYAIIVALIALVIATVVTALGGAASDLFADPQLHDALRP